MKYEPIDATTERTAKAVVECGFQVHRYLGPGLLESVYEEALVHELRESGVPFVRQELLPIEYKGIYLSTPLRIDLCIDGKVIVEVKSTETIHPVYEAQLLTYMKLRTCRLGFIFNFNVARFRDGILRRVL